MPAHAQRRPLARRPIPRRALSAATLGALYGLLLLPTPGPVFLGLNLLGVAWFFLAVGLLFLQPLAYHTYSVWSVVWVAWKGVGAWRAGVFEPLTLALDIGLPLVSLLLLTSSAYLEQARAWDAAEG